MVVVDIRNVFAVRNVEIIEINDDFIYYAEEKKEEGHNNLFLLEYNRVSKRERVVTIIPWMILRLCSIFSAFLIVLCCCWKTAGDSVWVFRVDNEHRRGNRPAEDQADRGFSDCRL